METEQRGAAEKRIEVGLVEEQAHQWSSGGRTTSRRCCAVAAEERRRGGCLGVQVYVSVQCV